MDYNKHISIFKEYMTTLPAFDCSMEDFCINVLNDDYREEVKAIRKLTNKNERDKIKATLPAATISGTFSVRKKTGLIEHSGFIAVDIDSKDNPNIVN